MKPIYAHDCDACTFLGSGEAIGHSHDFYTCPKEISVSDSSTCCVARFGDKGSEYVSMTLEDVLWDESLAALDAGKERPSVYHCWVPELLECWRRARMHAFHPNPNRMLTAEEINQGAMNYHVQSSRAVTGRMKTSEPEMQDLRNRIHSGATDLRAEKISPVDYAALERRVLGYAPGDYEVVSARDIAQLRALVSEARDIIMEHAPGFTVWIGAADAMNPWTGSAMSTGTGEMTCEVPAGQIRAIRQVEPGFLKGTLYILGTLFHAQFIRVKYSEYRGGELAGIPYIGPEPQAYNEDGDGEQVPWCDDSESLCNTWWHQAMVHVDECAFATIDVPGFEGHYVLLVYPSEQ